ncbi:unnamed protein product, partial [Rotaria socialis]
VKLIIDLCCRLPLNEFFFIKSKMRVTTTNRTSKLQTPTRTKTSSTTILNEQTGHLQNGTTIVSPTSSNNVIRY